MTPTALILTEEQLATLADLTDQHPDIARKVTEARLHLYAREQWEMQQGHWESAQALLSQVRVEPDRVIIAGVILPAPASAREALSSFASQLALLPGQGRYLLRYIEHLEQQLAQASARAQEPAAWQDLKPFLDRASAELARAHEFCDRHKLPPGDLADRLRSLCD